MKSQYNFHRFPASIILWSKSHRQMESHLWPLYVRTQKPVLTSHILIVLSLLLLTWWCDHSEFLFTVFELLKSYHIVACGQKGNTGDIVVVPVQSFQALVAVEVPQLDRHVRAAARQHLTLFVQTDILKMNNLQSSFHQILASHHVNKA